MESDDDYESFSPEKTSPSPSPKHRRLKRLKKAAETVSDQSVTVEKPVSDVVESETLETLEMSDIRAVEESGEAALSEGFDNGDNDNDKDGDDDSGKDKELRSCYDDTRVDSELNDSKRDDLSLGDGDVAVRVERKETKRALDFDEEFNESDLVKSLRNEGEFENSTDVKSSEDDEKDGNFDAINGKIKKKKRSKRSREEIKANRSKEEIKVKPKKPTNKKAEEKERKAHLEQLHAESQRLLREARGVSFKPVPLVQKPISSILERIRQRKLEMSKKFSQSVSNDPVEEDDDCIKENVMDCSKSEETENGDLSETLEEEKKEKVSSDVNGEPESVDAGTDESDVSKEPKSRDIACSPKAMNVESTPVLRAPVDDTQKLFGDDQSTDSKESEDEESGEQTTSSQEEEMGPLLLTMQLKFDSVPDDISDEENDKENANPHGQRQVKDSSCPRGDPVKAFVDEEAEEEDDSDNDRMLFGDEEENEDDDDLEELSKMIATGYKEKPIDKETRDELHQKWLQEKDAAGTDDLLRRLNVASKLREASLLDEEDDEEDVEMIDDDEEDEEREERPRAARLDSKKAKELIANMFTDKDEDFLSSDDEETEKILVKERVLNKAENKGKLVSPGDDEDSREVFGLIKKLKTVPEARKKAKTTSFFYTMLTGGNSNSSSKSSFLSRASSHSVPTSSKQKGSSGVRSFIFGRDDSNSRSSISISEDTSDTITSREVQTKKVATRYSSSQSQARSLTQTTKLVTESSSTTSLFEILKQSSMQSNVRKEDHKVELSQSVFAAFKIPKKPVKISGRV